MYKPYLQRAGYTLQFFAGGLLKLSTPRYSKGMAQTITIATLAIGHDFCKELEPCLKSKEAYASRHGYTYRQGGAEFWNRERPIPWSKVPFVLRLLSELPEGALVWLSDADVLVTNPTLTLETHVVPLLPDSKDLLMCIDACGHLNSGNMLMRNSPWLRDFWGRIGEQTDLVYHIWWENAALIKLLELNPSDLARTEIISEHTRFNSYLQGLPGQPLWIPTHFLVHFAGVYDLKRMRGLVAAIQAGKIPRLSISDPNKIEYISI